MKKITLNLKTHDVVTFLLSTANILSNRKSSFLETDSQRQTGRKILHEIINKKK